MSSDLAVIGTAGPPEGCNLLELVPLRKAGWSEDSGRVVLQVPPPRRRLPALIEKLLPKPAGKRLRLDDVGSLAWNLLDGRRTLAEVAAELRQSFGDRVEPAEERLGILLSSLHRGGLIGYLGYDEIPEPSEPR